MNVLLIGDCNSIHIVNFIKVVLSNSEIKKITIFDMNRQGLLNKDNDNYYKENGIELIRNNSFTELVKNKMIRKIPIIRSIIYFKLLNRKIEELEDFEYCLLHYIDITKVKLVLKNRNKYKKVIPIFWGSDLLRNKNINSNKYEQLLNISNKVIFNTENMKRSFEKIYKKKFKEKIEVIKFPTLSFQKIDQLQKKNNLQNIRIKHGIPNEKLIVICGHSGYRAEQYEKLIESLSKCSMTVKQKTYFIFMMTYGSADLEEYQKKIKSLIKENNLDGQVFCNYIKQEELLQIIKHSNIYISTITTDAFSAVMQEHLYTESVVIYGKWLNYYEIEQSRILSFPIEEVKFAGEMLEEIVTNYEYIKPKLKLNKELISKISSHESIEETWNKKVFSF